MNFQTLDNITKLFAIVINKNTETNIDSLRKEYENFIDARIENKYIHTFIQLFDNYLNEFSSFKSHKKMSLNSVKLIAICEEIKTKLPLIERLIITYELLILTQNIKNNEISLEFIKTISEIFLITETSLQKISDFVNDNSLDTTPENDIINYQSEKKFLQDLLSVQKSRLPSFKLTVKNLEIKIKNKILLHKFSCEFRSGELVGIIGKSGSGKTTFLKTLAGYNKKFIGNIDYDTKNSRRAFVAQQNSFIPLFSVVEHLQQRADFLNIKKATRDKIFADILTKVALENDSTKIATHTDDNGFQLSGGQQKRLAIAMELLTDPHIFLLDEPTSGLASNDTQNIISLLKSIAEDNKIVIASIHQPDYEVFMEFDKILIIDEDGYPIYFGTPTNAIQYFREIFGRIDKNSMLETYYNPSVLLNLIDEELIDDAGEKTGKRVKTAQELYEKFLENELSNLKISTQDENVATAHSVNMQTIQNHNNSVWTQLKFSLKVDLKNKNRLIIFLLLPLIISVLISFLSRYSNSEDYTFFYNKNIPIWLLMLQISAIFIGLVSSAHEFIFLRNFHKIENLVRNKKTSENIAKIIKYFLLSAVQSAILTIPAVHIVAAEFHLIYLFSMICILIFWGNLVSMIMSKLFRTTTIIYLLIPLMIIPQMIFFFVLIPFSNFNKNYPKFCEMPLGSSFMPIRWAAEACMTKFFIDNQFNRTIYFNRIAYYNAEYYENYVLPEIKKLLLKDTVLATILLENESDKLFDKNLSLKNNFDNIENYYKKLKKYQQNEIDKKTSKINYLCKLKYSNAELDKIIINYLQSDNYTLKNKHFLRKYLPIYNQSKSFKENFIFFTGIKKLGNNYLFTYNYNFAILLIYNLLLMTLLFFIKEKD